MDYQEAIKALQFEGGIEITGKLRRVAEFFDAIDVAISAMQELQELKVSDDNLNDLIQELKQAKYDIETFLEDHTASSRAMQRAINALIEVKLYKQLGTPEEVREAVEKQRECKYCGYKTHSDRISELNSCNDCGLVNICEKRPEYGQYCRINCYDWRCRNER